ncbi:MAG: MlaD family protein [Puniceicoccaceae bacterium]
MKRLSNATLVGIFVLVAAFLGIATIIYVGSSRLFKAEEDFIVYFGESVNGLTVGAPVKFKGVPIGQVRDIRITYKQRLTRGDSYIPVFFSIDLKKVGRKLDQNLAIDLIDPLKFEEEIRNGLRAKLQLESFLTGLLYIELDYYENPGIPSRWLQMDEDLKEIPSLPSDMAEFGAKTTDILGHLASLDVEGISNRLVRILERLDTVMHEIDFKGMNSSVVDTTATLRDALEELQLDQTVPALRETLLSLKSVADKLEGAIDPAVADYQAVMKDVSGTLQRSNEVLNNLEELTSVDSRTRRELVKTLEALQRASQSAEELLAYLERNPRALISGRAQP